MVECKLPKLKVAGSNPVARSMQHSKMRPDYQTCGHCLLNNGAVVFMILALAFK